MVLLSALTAGPAATASDRSIRLATATSTDNSGLLEYLLPMFEAATGRTVKVLAVGTGKALELARRGDVDLVLTHAPARERAFIEAGFGIERVPLMANRFLLVGPRDDPAGIRGCADARSAMRAIAVKRTRFISRGDDSGTHLREMDLWRTSGHPDAPNEAWLLEAGQGQSRTLQLADELGAYALTDSATWLAHRDALPHTRPLCTDPALVNDYALIGVPSSRFTEVNEQGAAEFIQWLTSAAGRQAIDSFRIDGERAFDARTADRSTAPER